MIDIPLGLDVKSKSNSGITYHFGINYPEGLPNGVELVTTVHFPNPKPDEFEALKKVVEDFGRGCEIRVTYEVNGIGGLERFLKACGVKANPLYIHKVTR